MRIEAGRAAGHPMFSLLALGAIVPAQAGQPYVTELVVTTGASVPGLGTLAQIGTGVTIDCRGDIGFVGRTGAPSPTTAEAVLVASPGGAVTVRYGAGGRTFSDLVEFSALGNLHYWYWLQPTSTTLPCFPFPVGTNVTVAQARAPDGSAVPGTGFGGWYCTLPGGTGVAQVPGIVAITSRITANNFDEAVFTGLPLSGSTVLIKPYQSGGGVAFHQVLAANGPLYPRLSDAGTTVVRWGNTATSPIFLLAPDLLNATVLASTATGFGALGEKPDISDNGDFVVFAGNRGAGDGVYVGYRTDGGQPVVAPVAGDGADAFTAIDRDQRVCVREIQSERVQQPTDPNASVPRRSLLSVCFVGTKGGVQGVWVVDVLASRTDANLFVRKGEPHLVAAVGGIVGGKTISSLTLSDSLNPCSSVACRASFSDGTAGVLRAARRAAPTMPRQVRIHANRVFGGGLPAPLWTVANVAEVVARAGTLLAPAGIELVLTGIHDVTDPLAGAFLFDFDTSILQAAELAIRSSPAQYGWQPDAINVYLVNSIDGPVTAATLGVASFPLRNGTGGESLEVVFVRPGYQPFHTPAAIDESAETLAHELGHYLGLFHTHATSTGIEVPPTAVPAATYAAINGCRAGDLLADTPPDPNDQSTLATWYGVGGPAYATVFTNLMSYYPNATTVTPGQVARANQTLDLLRAGVLVDPSSPAGTQTLGSGCSSTGPAPVLMAGPPRIGRELDVWLTGAPSLRQGTLYFSLPPPSPTVLGPGCTVYLDLGGVLPLASVLTDASGGWTGTVLALPPVPGLIGVVVNLQALVAGLTPGAFEISSGLALTIGT